jgi:hypothetical protein
MNCLSPNVETPASRFLALIFLNTGCVFCNIKKDIFRNEQNTRFWMLQVREELVAFLIDFWILPLNRKILMWTVQKIHQKVGGCHKMWLAKVFRPYHKRSLAQLRSEQTKVAWLPTILGDLGASCENVTPKHLSAWMPCFTSMIEISEFWFENYDASFSKRLILSQDF